jgi:hypothetical protein
LKRAEPKEPERKMELRIPFMMQKKAMKAREYSALSSLFLHFKYQDLPNEGL